MSSAPPPVAFSPPRVPGPGSNSPALPSGRSGETRIPHPTYPPRPEPARRAGPIPLRPPPPTGETSPRTSTSGRPWGRIRGRHGSPPFPAPPSDRRNPVRGGRSRNGRSTRPGTREASPGGPAPAARASLSRGPRPRLTPGRSAGNGDLQAGDQRAGRRTRPAGGREPLPVSPRHPVRVTAGDHSSRNACAMVMREARKAGRKPPATPMSMARKTPVAISIGVTLN